MPSTNASAKSVVVELPMLIRPCTLGQALEAEVAVHKHAAMTLEVHRDDLRLAARTVADLHAISKLVAIFRDCWNVETSSNVLAIDIAKEQKYEGWGLVDGIPGNFQVGPMNARSVTVLELGRRQLLLLCEYDTRRQQWLTEIAMVVEILVLSPIRW